MSRHLKPFGLAALILLLASCTATPTDSPTVPTTVDSSTSTSSETSSEPEPVYETVEYSYSFTGDEVNSSGGSTESLNGLTWYYDAATFYFPSGDSSGFQIGSNGDPQDTPWNIRASLVDDARVLGYSVGIGTTGRSTVDAVVSFGEVSESHTASGDSGWDGGKLYSNSGYDEPSDFFSLTMTASGGGMYLYSISITLSVPEGTGDDIGGGEEPDVPDIGGGEEGGGNTGEGGGSTGGGSGSGDATGEIPDGALEPRYDAVDVNTYYSGVDLTLTGSALRTALNELISNKTTVSYDDARYALLYTDQSLTDDTKIVGIWDGDLLNAKWDSAKTWNREHVWPSSRFAQNSGAIYSDLYNLHPVCVDGNNARGNHWLSSKSGYFYPNITSGLPGSHNYTGDWRGDAARTLFYMYTCYTQLKLSDGNGDADYTMGFLSELLEWNKEDPVDEFEARRNDRVSMYQNNRNPFIDHPELADQLFE